MLKVRIIPTLLWKKFGLVKGLSFNSWRRVGSVLPAIKVYNARDVDELILVDIEASQEQREPDYEFLKEFGEDCFVPLTVGGGITKIDQVQKLLRSGADKVCLNSSLYKNPKLISEIANKHGSQCVVASIDVKKNGEDWWCFSHSGRIATGKRAESWARDLASRGAGELILTSIDRDGTMQGYDLDLIQMIASVVSIPVIASGGAGNYQHMIDAIQKGGASAVAAASIFHFTECTPKEAKMALAKEGIPIRKNYEYI